VAGLVSAVSACQSDRLPAKYLRLVSFLPTFSSILMDGVSGPSDSCCRTDTCCHSGAGCNQCAYDDGLGTGHVGISAHVTEQII
jgi:hypothetical protein